MLVDCCRAPSAFCAREMPSLALRTATPKPLIWLVRRLDICRPAASSLALLMREPVDRHCKEVFSALDDELRLRWVLSDAMLVLTVRAMVFASNGLVLKGSWALRALGRLPGSGTPVTSHS